MRALLFIKNIKNIRYYFWPIRFAFSSYVAMLGSGLESSVAEPHHFDAASDLSRQNDGALSHFHWPI
jgi:hypothetical protein